MQNVPFFMLAAELLCPNGYRELRLFAKENNFPVTMTLQGLGAFPMTDPQSLGNAWNAWYILGKPGS